MDEDVLTRVIEIATDVLGVEEGVVSEKSTAEDIESWDSFAQLSLLMALEDEFSVRFSPGDMQDMTGIAVIARMVSSQRGS